MNYKGQGEIVELKFFLKSFENGLIVSKPFGDNQKYDFIVDAENRLSRVQVKSTFQKDKYSQRNTNRYRINSSFGASRKKQYTKKEIDILVVYIQPEDAWYIIPVDNVCKIKTLSFYPHLKSGKMESFRERWDLFYPATFQQNAVG
jgi:hypothetical protein